MSKETFEIDVFVTSRNGDIKIMRSIRITSRPPEHLGTAGSIEASFFSNKFDWRPLTFKDNSED